MAKSLSFDDGVVEYEINGAAKVRFNPGDAKFAQRVYDVFKDLESRQGEFQRRVDEIGGEGEGMFEYARERDAEMRGVIDGLLGEGVANALFPDINCYALADGLPVWVNLFFAIVEEVQAAFEAAEAAGAPRLDSISQKNADLLARYRKATAKR